MSASSPTLPLDTAPLVEQLARIEQELQRRNWAESPSQWARERLHDDLWSGQIKICNSVRDHRKTAVPTCHEIGKSYIAAILAAWWIDTHKPGEAFVITTAPTEPQVKVILWKEIGRAHQRGSLRGRINQKEWKMMVGNNEETVALGRKPSDYSPTAFQGIHAPYVLIIVDESNGVRGQLWDAIDSMMANDGSKILAIGNPDDPSGEFYEACKPNSGWSTIHISAFDSPNFTGEPMPDAVLRQLIGRTYVEEKRRKWAPTWQWIGNQCVPPPDGRIEDTHPFWQSKVLGQFPVQGGVGSLIPLMWIRAAQNRDLMPSEPNEFGLDVGASEGGDPTCLGHRQGPVFRVIYEERQPDTMKTTGKLIAHLRNPMFGASRAKVDYIGVGRGVVDRSKEQDLPVYPVQVSEASTVLSCLVCKHEFDIAQTHTKKQLTKEKRCPMCGSDQTKPVFANLLSQLWWQMRERFEQGDIDIDPNDEELAEQLLTIFWEPNSKGQTVVKYGEGPSPNRADALLMAYAPVITESTVAVPASMTSAATW